MYFLSVIFDYQSSSPISIYKCFNPLIPEMTKIFRWFLFKKLR